MTNKYSAFQKGRVASVAYSEEFLNVYESILQKKADQATKPCSWLNSRDTIYGMPTKRVMNRLSSTSRFEMRPALLDLEKS